MFRDAGRLPLIRHNCNHADRNDISVHLLSFRRLLEALSAQSWFEMVCMNPVPGNVTWTAVFDLRIDGIHSTDLRHGAGHHRGLSGD